VRRRRGAEALVVLPPSVIAKRAEAAGLRLAPSQVRAAETLAEVLAGPPPRRGVWLHGPAGRGKTWLLDAVAAGASLPVVRRHLHELSRELDDAVGRGPLEPGWLNRGFATILDGAGLLCLDEVDLAVPDDAFLLMRLLRLCGARGVPVVATSNAAPEELLPDPRFHHWVDQLAPEIREACAVVDVDDGIDHRGGGRDRRDSRSRFAAGGAVGDDATALDRHGLVLTGLVPRDLHVSGRLLACWHVEVERRLVVFALATLCETPRSTRDYLQLRDSYDVWVVLRDGLGDLTADGTRRLVGLLDVLHDRDAELTLVTRGPVERALAGSAVELARSRSRLSLLST